MRRFRKKYGEYKTDICPYCGKSAMVKNAMGLNVCKEHKETTQDPNLRTSTGEWLEVKVGKFGNYCYSPTRGSISVKDVFLMMGRDVEQ
ncbi:MAG: hypothetical protein ACMXYA_01030 [Candidatus Woesearchaeota archaeon]